MKKWLSISLKALSGILLLTLILWFSLVGYVYSHKDKVLEMIAAQLNDNTIYIKIVVQNTVDMIFSLILFN